MFLRDHLLFAAVKSLIRNRYADYLFVCSQYFTVVVLEPCFLDQRWFSIAFHFALLISVHFSYLFDADGTHIPEADEWVRKRVPWEHLSALNSALVLS